MTITSAVTIAASLKTVSEAEGTYGQERDANMQISTLFPLFVGACFVGIVWSRSSGPPSTENFERVCRKMLPDHINFTAQSDQNGGYLIDTDLPRLGSNTSFTYTAGQTYKGRKL